MSLASTFLIADIGATHARFQLADEGALRGDVVRLSTVAHADAQTLLAAGREALGETRIDAAILAVAGPRAEDGSFTLTNTGQRFAVAPCGEALGCSAAVVNDFYAQAHGVPHFKDLVPIGAGLANTEAPMAIVGAGTGLGAATLVPTKHGLRVLPSEVGHAGMALGSHLEAELWGMLAQSHEHVSWETVLSGPGLVRLYAAMCSLWGAPAQTHAPVDIVTAGVAMSDPVCHQTLETFCGLLGEAAASVALTVCATGGIYLAGGVVRGMVDFVVSSPLRRRFDECGDLSDFARGIPLWVVGDVEPGLVGAHRCLLADASTGGAA